MAKHKRKLQAGTVTTQTVQQTLDSFEPAPSVERHSVVDALAAAASPEAYDVLVERPHVLPAAACTRGEHDAVHLTDAVTALLIISDCAAKFCGNFWQVTSRKTGKTSGVADGAATESWCTEIKRITSSDAG
jgi:hypothetical protein